MPHTSIVSHVTKRVVPAVAAVLLLSAFAACGEDSTSPNSPVMHYGAGQALGNGTARTYVAVDSKGKPVSIGVALSDAALTNLPNTPNAPSPSAVMLTLAMPTSVTNTGYNHVMLDWNPQGHEPDQVYTHPHFDFHFYQITPAERDAIMPNDPAWATKLGTLPAAQYRPAGYKAGHELANIPAEAAGVPMMGMHWLDTSSPELQPPPANHLFTETFIYGSYNGKFIFVEPMITKAHIESVKGTAGVSRAVPAPAQVQNAAYYPSKVGIRYDAASKEYRISLDALTYKQ